MERIKATIGVCVKNSEKTIGRAIKSVIYQDFPHDQMELIIVDGYSEDKTLSIIKENIIRTDIETGIFYEDKGLGYARQIVVDNAEGDYIIWIDGDMILPKDYIRKQVEFIEKNENVGAAAGKYGFQPGETLVSALENMTYRVDDLLNKGKINSKRTLGTEGSIFRLEAIKQAGGFDKNIKGAAEDSDIAYRIEKAGWSVCITQATFYENCRETWKELWDQYFWYGYGGHYVHHKGTNVNPLYTMLPMIGFFAGLLSSLFAYRLIARRFIFLMPFHYVFKRAAWCFGFLIAHLDNYGHKK